MTRIANNNRLCSLPTCTRPLVCKGYCEMHYCRWKKYGDPLEHLPHVSEREKSKCSVTGCGKNAYSNSFCNAHYLRWKRYGDPAILKGTSPGEPLSFIQNKAMNYDGEACLIWPYSRDGNGYGQIWLDGKLTPVCRIVCERAYGEPPTDFHQAAHRCGRGHLGCVTKEHLRWATPVENNADKMDHGTYLEGEDNPSSKLTAEQVLEIRRLHSVGVSYTKLRDQFDTCVANISQIVNGKTWRSLNDA